MSVRRRVIDKGDRRGHSPHTKVRRNGDEWSMQAWASLLWDGEPWRVLARMTDHRTLYGARMAARQARIDYSPGGRLYAEGGK